MVVIWTAQVVFAPDVSTRLLSIRGPDRERERRRARTTRTFF